MALLDLVLGRALSSSEDQDERAGSFAGVSVFGLDALSSAAYGPEAALTVLIPLGLAMDISVTASLIDTMDVVISVDTMVGHHAGALGKKVYLLLHSEADWRWLRDREDSPWYPTVTLLRQPRAGDWRSVVTRLMDLFKKANRS